MLKSKKITEKEIIKYFNENGLEELIISLDNNTCSERSYDIVSKRLELEKPYAPELLDLYNLHRMIIENKRLTILEFGCGWSTIVMAHALFLNKREYSSEVKKFRKDNVFELHVIDNMEKYIDITKNNLSKYNIDLKVVFHFSDVNVYEFQGKLSTRYDILPQINPDFIYLDGPDQFNIKGKINGLNIAHLDFMPMSSDLLLIEHFLVPGTIIVIDGRTSNYRFLKCNFQRNWSYDYNEESDQHILYMQETPLGIHNKKLLDFYSNFNE